jgi:CTP:molybdopterin cytidylyltransferase MocA
MLERILATIREAGLERVVVVLGDHAAEIRSQISLAGVTVVENTQFAEGMSSSLRAGVRAIDPAARYVLTVLADQPFVSSKTLRTLVRRSEEGDGSIFIPTYRGVWGNPVLFDARFGADLEQVEGDVGCRGMFPKHTDEIREVPVDDPGILVDIDTESELRSLESALATGATLPVVLDRLAQPRWALHSSPEEHPIPKRLIRPPNLEGANVEISHDPPSAKPNLLIVGDSPVATSLAALGTLLGYRVTLAAPGIDAAYLPEVDQLISDLGQIEALARPGTFAIVASMGKYDESALAQISRGSVAFVGLVASHKRASSISAALRDSGVPADQIARIRCPVGIDIAASTPEEIALSIMAELTQIRRTTPSLAGTTPPESPPAGDPPPTRSKL